MGGCSTFFPRHWSPQRVVDAINEAYRNKQPIETSEVLFLGNANGIKIKMRIDLNGKISSVYPIMEEIQ